MTTNTEQAPSSFETRGYAALLRMRAQPTAGPFVLDPRVRGNERNMLEPSQRMRARMLASLSPLTTFALNLTRRST
jgi:hypothetical protein